MIRGIIFDMDGVIIDSNHIHFETMDSVLKNHFHIEISEKEFSMQLGKSSKHFINYFIEKYNIRMDYNNLVDEILKEFSKNKKKIVLKDGLIECLQNLKSYHYRIALATGADKKTALSTVRNFDIESFFDFIVGGDEVKVAKPDPEIFLKAGKGLKLTPKECVVVEDANLGLLAAKRAKMKCIILEDRFTKHHDLKLADYRLDSLLNLNFALLEKLGG